jgi:small-conductance mechanosensitive channel
MTPETDWLQAFGLLFAPWVALLGEISWVRVLIQLMLALIAVMIFHYVGTHALQRITASLPFSRRLVDYGHRLGGVALFLLLAQLLFRNASDELPGIEIVRHVNALLLITAMTWLIVRCIKSVGDTIIELNPSHVADNLQARRIQTQTRVLTRALMSLAVVIGASLAMMTLPILRQIGASLLASAGVAGIVVGLAARPVLSNLLAGLQIAIAQPIRLDDVVIVEGEWGWIEEITGTYVVVRIWDQRRLVLPLQWFIENPFQNWTRTSSEILGTVTIWVDYRMPVDEIRAEAERICRDAAEWDGRLCQVQVVDASDRAMQVRVLVSAADAGRAWDLRCLVRERLVHYIQQAYPEHLPHIRADIDNRSEKQVRASDPQPGM